MYYAKGGEIRLIVNQNLQLNNEVVKGGIKSNKFRFIIFSAFLLAVFTILPFYKAFSGVTALYLLKYLSFIFFVLTLIQQKNKKVDHISLYLLFFITLFGAISFFNIEPTAMTATGLYLAIGIGIVLCSELYFKEIKREVFQKICWVILLAITIVVLIPSLEQSRVFSAYYISTEGRYRFNGIFSNSNELARFCLLSFLISLRMLNVKKNRFVTLFLWFNIVASAYIIHLSDSRTCAIVGVLGVVLYTISHLFLKSPKVTLFLGYFAVCVALILLIPSAYNLASKPGSFDLNQLLSGRLDSWKPVFEQNFVDLLFGTGTIREGLASSVVLVNGYIEIVQYFGLLGLFFWLLFIGYMLLKKIKITLKSPNISNIQGLIIVLLFSIYYLFEGGLVSIGNLASIYFWLELSQRDA